MIFLNFALQTLKKYADGTAMTMFRTVTAAALRNVLKYALVNPGDHKRSSRHPPRLLQTAYTNGNTVQSSMKAIAAAPAAFERIFLLTAEPPFKPHCAYCHYHYNSRKNRRSRRNVVIIELHEMIVEIILYHIYGLPGILAVQKIRLSVYARA